MLDSQDVLRDLSGGVERRTDDLVRLDRLLLVEREPDCRVCQRGSVCGRGTPAVQPAVAGLAEVHLRGFCRDKADEAGPGLAKRRLSMRARCRARRRRTVFMGAIVLDVSRETDETGMRSRAYILGQCESKGANGS